MSAHMKELGIDKGIVLSSGDAAGTMCPNAEACTIHERYSETFAGFMCNIDECEPSDVPGMLEIWKDRGAVGVGELTILSIMQLLRMTFIIT